MSTNQRQESKSLMLLEKRLSYWSFHADDTRASTEENRG